MLRGTIIIIRNHKKIIPLFIIVATLAQGTLLFNAWEKETFPDYNIFIVPFVNHCSLDKYPQRDGYQLQPDNVTAIHNGIYKDTRDPLKWYVNCLSYKTTGSASFIPILFSIGLIPLVYLISMQLTNDRLIGLIATIAFTLNPLYSDWSASATYDQTWSFFLILSVYLMFRFNGTQFAIPALIASLAAKGLGVLYLPVWVYSLWKTKASQQNKLFGLGIFFLFFGAVGIYLSSKVNLIGGDLGFYPSHLQDGLLQNMSILYGVIPTLIIFAIIYKVIKPKERTKNRGLVFSWIVSAFMTTPLIYLFTNQFQFVYRFVPLAVFMSIFIAMTIIETGNYIVQLKLLNNKQKVSGKES